MLASVGRGGIGPRIAGLAHNATVTSLPTPPNRIVADITRSEFAHAIKGSGIWFNVGVATLHLRSDSAILASQLQSTYCNFPFVDKADWADLHVQIGPASGLRRWFWPQVVMSCDGQQPFDPFPADSPLPLFEWGCNWLIGRRLNDMLLLHAGVVEKDGFALVLPALPGSGKSTLTAALSQTGWRLLSDEFGAYDPISGLFQAVLKPIALKNESIAVIRSFAPQAAFGPTFPKTRKGSVAHLAAQPDAVSRRHMSARPGAVVLPRWEAGSETKWEPLQDDFLFPALAFNAFILVTSLPIGGQLDAPALSVQGAPAE